MVLARVRITCMVSRSALRLRSSAMRVWFSTSAWRCFCSRCSSRMRLTRWTMMSAMKGLAMKSSAPICRPCTSTSRSSSAVRKMTGISQNLSSAFNISKSSNPFISGI